MSEHILGPCPHCLMGGPDDPGICVLPEGSLSISHDMAGTFRVMCRYCGTTFEQTIIRPAQSIPPPPAPQVGP